jgi:two-component system sensor histidine kinase YesM
MTKNREKSRLRQKITNMPLRRKFLSILLMYSLVVILLFTACYRLMASAYDKVSYRSFAANLNFTGSSIRNKLQQTENLSYTILASSLVQEALTTLHDSENPDSRTISSVYNTLTSYLLSMYDSNRGAIAYIAISAGDNIFTTSSYTKEIDLSILHSAENSAADEEGSPVWVMGSEDSGYLYLVREIRKIDNLSLEDLGCVIIALNVSDLLEESDIIIRTFGQYNTVLNYKGATRANLSGDVSSVPDEIRHMQPGDYERVNIEGHNYFAACSYVPDYTDFTIAAFIPYDEITSNLYRTVILIFCVILIGVLILLQVTDRLVDSILIHIDRLVEKINAFSQQKPIPEGMPDYSTRTDEIGVLHRQFDNMTTQITTLIDQNYKNEILYREAQIRALESQINPHFLYNTLDTIYWKAQLSGSEEIALMAESLGKMLRATLSSHKSLIPLREELSLIQSYITIQEIRYNNRLVFTFAVQDGIDEALIPTLSLQPLVENAIKYGLEETIDTCHITVEALHDGTCLICRVKNDGSVFEDDLLDKLQKKQDSLPKERKGHGFGIGLLNIQTRIHLLFGDSYGLSLTNEDGFAVASMRIPYQTAPAEQDNQTDRS